MDVCYGDKKGIPAGVYLFSRYKRAETDATFSPLAFTSFLFRSAIPPVHHPMSAPYRVVCKQTPWGVLSRLIRTLARSRRTLFPSTPNARTSLERAIRVLSILFRLYLLLTMP